MSAPLETLLVPTDGSEGALRAASFAGRLAAATGAKIVLLHVVHAGSTAQTIGLAAQTKQEFQGTIRSMSEATLEKTRAAISEEIEIEEIGEFGEPAAEIISAARSRGADLVVMGSRGLSPLREMLLGSVSEKVVRRAPCPVTVVR